MLDQADLLLATGLIVPAQLWANHSNVNNPAAAIQLPQTLRAILIGIGPKDTHLSTNKHSHQKHNAKDTEQGQLDQFITLTVKVSMS